MSQRGLAMKQLLLGIGGALALAVGGILVAASMQPDTYQIVRTANVSATPADVFPYFNDYDKWDTWNPWGKLDPNMKVTKSDVKVGAGAWNAWEGNSDVGSGKMSLIESVANEKTVHKLEFKEPMESTGMVTFAVAAAGEGSKVSWTMDGTNDMMGKVFGLFVDMDAMIGADFDRGLGTLKPLVEADAKARVETERLAAEAAAAARLTAPVDPNAVVDPNTAVSTATAVVQ